MVVAVLQVLLLPLLSLPAAAAEGCIVSEPQTVDANPCTYTASIDAEYVATGTWTMAVRRGDTVLRYGSALGDPAVGLPGVIRPGDVVTVSVSGTGSSITAGTARPVAISAGSTCVVPQGGYGSGGPPGKGYPNDPLFVRQWGLAQVNVPQAWRQGMRGRGVVVAVVDTGVDLKHPDLDDKLVPGVDLLEGSAGPAAGCPAGPQDEQYHGTLVAGVIGAETGNNQGIAGVAPAARLMPVRVRDRVESMDFQHVGAGIRWAVDHGAKVISVTGGTVVPLRPAPVVEEDIADAAAYAWEHGAAVVATAGNNGLPWCQYPAAAEHVICAAATDRQGAPSSYSNFPVRPPSGLAVRAPGGGQVGPCRSDDDIWSTGLPGSSRDCGGEQRGYATDAGTTFAVAHTAGVAALLSGAGLSNTQIVECLRATSSLRGSYDVVMGYGLIDAAAAARECVPRHRGRSAKPPE